MNNRDTQRQCAWTFELTPGSPLKVDVNPMFFNMHPSARLGTKSEILHVLISSIESSKDTWNQTQLDCFGRQSTTRTHHPIQLNQILGNQTFMNLLFSLQYTWFSDHFQDCYHIILSCWQVFHDYSHTIISIFPDHSQHDFHYSDFHDSFILFTYHFHEYFH